MRSFASLRVLLDAQWFSKLACALLTLPFWTSGFAKLGDWPGAIAEAGHFGLDPAWLVVASTILVQIGGSALIFVRSCAWLGAGALGVFTAAATLIAHPFWTIADPVMRLHDRNTFAEHIGLIGGLMLAAVLAQRQSPAA